MRKLEKVKPFGHSKAPKKKKIMIDFAHFPRPGENYPYVLVEFNILCGMAVQNKECEENARYTRALERWSFLYGVRWLVVVRWRLKLAVKKLKVHIWKLGPANFINHSRPPEVRATNLITNFKIETAII